MLPLKTAATKKKSVTCWYKIVRTWTGCSFSHLDVKLSSYLQYLFVVLMSRQMNRSRHSHKSKSKKKYARGNHTQERCKLSRNVPPTEHHTSIHKTSSAAGFARKQAHPKPSTCACVYWKCLWWIQYFCSVTETSLSFSLSLPLSTGFSLRKTKKKKKKPQQP